MADLGQLLGTLLASLAHARRIADEETAMIAEHYKDNPLLEGMSLPRVRVPELTLDLPLLIASHEEGEANEPEDVNVIIQNLCDELNELIKREQVKVSATSIKHFKTDLDREIKRLQPQSAGNASFPKEVVVRAVDRAFGILVKRENTAPRTATTRTSRTSRATTTRPRPQPVKVVISHEQAKRMASDLRRRASEVALKKEGIPPTLEASIITSEVKESAGNATVSRLKVTMKEEGLEWSVAESEDGTRTKTLTPE